MALLLQFSFVVLIFFLCEGVFYDRSTHRQASAGASALRRPTAGRRPVSDRGHTGGSTVGARGLPRSAAGRRTPAGAAHARRNRGAAVQIWLGRADHTYTPNAQIRDG